MYLKKFKYLLCKIFDNIFVNIYLCVFVNICGAIAAATKHKAKLIGNDPKKYALNMHFSINLDEFPPNSAEC